MASRQNLTRRGNAYKGYGTLANAYRQPSTGENPMMTKYKAQQKSSKGVNRNDMTKQRIAKAQQTGADRGTQKQIVRSSTPGGGGYDRAAAVKREQELSRMSESDQMLHLGRRANPNAGQPGQEKFNSRLEGKSLDGAIMNAGAGQYTPEQKQRWREDQQDKKNPFGPRMRKGESGTFSAEQKQMWRRGETPRQQLAGITGGQAGIDRAMGRMRANSGAAQMRDAGVEVGTGGFMKGARSAAEGGTFKRAQAPTGPNIGAATTAPTSPLSSTQSPIKKLGIRSRGIGRRV